MAGESIITKIFRLIKPPSSEILGIDVGLGTIKVAQLVKQEETYKVVKMCCARLPEGVIVGSEIEKPQVVIDGIKKCLKDASIGNISACIGIHGENSMVKKLQLAGGSYEEVEDQVLWEVEQYLPFDVEDSMISFDIVEEKEEGGVDVVIGAAKRDFVEEFKEIVEQAGLTVQIVDMSIVALVNVFDFLMGDSLEFEKLYLLIDIGAQTTDFVVLQDGAIIFTREITFGGSTITEEVQRQMGLKYEDAEDLKINGDGDGNFPEEVVTIIDNMNQLFFEELKNVMDFFISTSSSDPIHKCYATGGGAVTLGVMEGLQDLLGVDVEVINPFDKVLYDKKKFSEEQIEEFALTGVVAMGLAMREK